MTYAEFKQNFLPELIKIKSFRGKIDYANQNLQRIGSGTGRIVYDIDGEKVLKLAKNPKGIAQNEAERNSGYYRDTHNIVAIVFDSAEDDNWLIAEKAKKVNEARIKQLTGIPSLNDLFYYVKNFNSSNHGGGTIFGQDPEMVEQLNENEFVVELTEFIANYSQQPGDYGRPSTYGEVLRDGQPTIVLTDYGLNDEVYNTHYSPDRKNKPQYRMYELYDNYDGNDDILGDMPPQDAIDTRRGMWAQLPYSVSDGPYVTNEGFISFILNRDKYPTRVLPSAPYIVDEFHNCVNNIDETLNHVKNKKKFYENLLKFQEYLIEQKLYDRESLGEIKYLKEDGSSLYSTDNAMGQDNFPVHNNIDTSPSIRNDLDANRDKNNEDLEYHNVVGDATKDQYMLDERQLSSMAGSSTVEVKKKCRLAGNGNTSTACNQGDIRNLNIKPLKEAQNPEYLTYNAEVEQNKQQEKEYLDRILKPFVELQKKYYSPYLTDEEMNIVYNWLISHNKTGDRKQDEQAYELRNKAHEVLAKENSEAIKILQDASNKYFTMWKKITNFFMKKRMEFGNKYSDERFAMAGNINVPEVSHFTTAEHAISILRDGVILSGDEGVSTTSNKNLIKDINPVFYHPQSWGYEGVTYKNLSVQFVLDFNKIKENGIKFKKGNEERGTHVGEEEIQLFPKENELDVFKYLKKAVIDFTKEKDSNKLNQLIEILKEKNIQYFIKNKSQNLDIIQETENSIIKEEISAKEAYTDQGAIKTVLNGKRKIGFVHINKPIAQILEKKKIGVIPIRMTSQNTMTAIIYRDKVKAYLLYEIAKRHGGYLNDRTPEEAHEIGRLLEYKEKDIEDFIRKNYSNKVPTMPEKSPDDYNDLAEDASLNFWDLNEESFPAFEKDIQQDLTTHQLDKKYIRSYQDGEHTYNVYAVNGDEVRDSGFIEWVDGGNHWVDADLPKNEQKYAKHIGENDYWIDDVFMVKPADFEAILLHERIESFIIRHYGYEYDDAHEIANKVELMFRKKIPEGANRALAEKIYNIFVANFKPEKSKQKHKPAEPVMNEVEEANSILHENIINEVGEANIIPYSYTIKNVEPNYSYNFITEDGDNYVVNFVMLKDFPDEDKEIQNKTWEIGFYAKNYSKNAVLNKGRLHRVMSTIVVITKDFIYKKKPILINYKAEKETGNPEDERRAKLYMAFVQKNLPVNYIMQQVEDEIFIVKKGFELNINENTILNEGQIMALNYLPFKEDVEEAGGKIYSVGGAVRDEILGKESKDLDILITGVPFEKLEEILSKYGAVNAVGKSFGILKFKPKGATEDIDIAIPRTETPTGEGGHQGFDVKSNHALPIEKDLERRDFTINAIAKDAEGNIVDPFGGQEDLKNKVIKVVNPQAFSDDPLRMLRAVQFASRFGFTIDPDTMKMIQENAGRVKEIAPERILTEFDKIVKKGNILTGAILLNETGLLKEIFGRGLYYDFKNTKEPFDKVRTMGEFVYLLSKNLVNDPAEFYKSNLKGDENAYKEIKALQIAFDSGEATNLIEARSIAHNMYVISPTSLQSQILPNVIKTAAQELLEGKYPKTVNELAVNGNDLMELGLQGKAVGDMQKSLLLKIYSNKVMNNKEDLLSLAGQNKPMIKEEVSERIEYGCLMLFLNVPVWDKITSVIRKDDLYIKDNDYGIEKEPHLTILYGFHDEVTPEQVFDLYKSKIPLKPIEVKISGISIFENFEFDVVKFDVNSDLLPKINDIMKKLPNTSKFPDYHAHITIAYVRKGEGKKYIKPFEKERILKGNELVYTWKGHMGKENGKVLMLNGEGVVKEGVADRYAEKQFNIPDPNTQNDVQAMGDIQKSVEEPIGYVTPYSSNDSAKEVPIYLNPKSLTNFADNVRVIVNDKGDLYIAQEDGRFNHGMMAKALGLFASDNGIYNDMNEYQLLHRVDNTNAFGLGDTAEDYIERKYENRVYLLNILRQAKRKNPQYDFYNEYYANIKGEPVSLNEFAYPEIRPEEKNTWNINGENVDIKFFVEKYDIWNQGGYADPSEASVLEFLQNNYEDFVHDEKLNKELLVALTDRNVLDETVLNEMSIQSIDYTDIITPEYIKEVEMSDNYERYIEYYQYEENMVHVDKEEIEKTENFKKWFTYELSVRFDDAVDNIKDKIKPDGTIDIWRRMTVDGEENHWINHLADAGKHLGIYWSWDERAAEAHWGDTTKNSNALIKSSIKEGYIDWKNTIYANMDLSLGEEEKEIRLFKNTSLKIEELNIDGQNVSDVMGVDYEQQLRNKTFYA